MDNPNVNSSFSFFADTTDDWGDTLKAFIFSLKNSESLPPFKCFAKYGKYAIYKDIHYGPSFGKRRYLSVGYRYRRSRAHIPASYSVPPEVSNKWNVLSGTHRSFSPDNYEVFYLA